MTAFLLNLRSGAALATTLLVGGALLGGCSTGSSIGSAISSSTSSVTGFFSGGSSKPTSVAAADGAPAPDFDCPGVTTRAGTGTLMVNAPNADPSATNLRYQASFIQTARECRLAAGTLTMKVGMQGRVILGPYGGPGTLDVPVRYVVVREGVEPKTIWSKLYRVKVEIPPGQTNLPFTHIIEDVAFPMPPGAEIDAYIVYVGFDPAGASDEDKRGKKPAPKPKKPAPTAMRLQTQQ
jgi:hypothetical protein